MPIVNPTVWAFRNLIAANGRRFEVRISKNQTFKYGLDNTTDLIFVDTMTFPKEYWGSTGMEEFDEDADMVPVSFDFGIADQFEFSGKLGDGTVISLQNLRTENTTLLSWIINDLSTNDSGKYNTTYYLYKSWVAEDGSIDEIYYSGSIDLSKTTAIPFYTEDFLSDTQTVLEIRKYQSSTISDILSNLYVQDFVEATHQSDMFTATREAAYAGYMYVKGEGTDFPGGDSSFYIQNPVVNTNGSFLGRVLIRKYESSDYPNGEGYLQCCYSRDLNTDMNPLNGNVVLNDRTNVYGVKHGWQFISYLVMINKIASLGKFIFDGSNSENPFSVYLPKYEYANNSDHYELSHILDDYLPATLCKNYNVLFGVRPDDPLLVLNAGQDLDASNNPDNTRGGILDWTTVISVSGSSPLIIELAASPPSGTLYAGQSIYYFNAIGSTGDFGDGSLNNMYVHSVIDSTHITLEFGEGVAGHTSGNIVNTGTMSTPPIIQWASEQWYDALQTPATFSRSDTLLTLLVAICNRFGYVMEWDIKQSGSDIGKPVLILRDILNCTTDAPDKWASDEETPRFLAGSETQTINLAKVAVALTSKGDSATVYCPRKPKVGEQIIQKEIMTRYKKWGEWNGYSKDNFINDKSKDVYSQLDTRYLINISGLHTINITTNGTGYLIGACDFYYLSNGAQIYNAIYNDKMQGHAANDTGGFYTLSYEDYHTGAISTFDQIKKDRFNPLVAKAIIMANHLLINKTMQVRTIRGIVDDSGSTRKLLRRLKTHWRDEFGNIVYKRASKIYINEYSDDATIYFANAKEDDTQFTELPYIIDQGTSGTGGPVSGGNIIGSGGGDGGGNTSTDTEATLTVDNTSGSTAITNSVIATIAIFPGIITFIDSKILGNRLSASGGGGSDGDGLTYQLKTAFKNIAGTVSVVGSDDEHPTEPSEQDDINTGASFNINGMNVEIYLTTPAHQKIKWKARVNLMTL